MPDFEDTPAIQAPYSDATKLGDLTVGQFRELMRSMRRRPEDSQAAKAPTNDDAYMFYDQRSSGFCTTSAHEVGYCGRDYPTAEHAFLAAQFRDSRIQELIADAKSGHAARAIYHAHRGQSVPLSLSQRYDLMFRVLNCKFAQHPDLLEFLVQTGTRPLVFNSFSDTLWGCGRDGTGHNHLGRILMQIRTSACSHPITP